MYLDSAYVAKFYVNEPDAAAVRKLIRHASHICSSSWALVEVTCVFHRHVREGSLTLEQGREMAEALLRKTTTLIRSLPPTVSIRARDAIHLASALDAGEPEIWTSDRHLLAAAVQVGIAGRRV